MRIVLSGGGTGGHLFPLVAIAAALRERFGPETQLFFIGAGSAWLDALGQEGVTLMPIPAGKIPRYVTPRLVWELIKIPIGMLAGFLALFRVMPDVVVGKGGYGMMPVVIAAWIFRIPVVLHESDAVPGVSNRIAAWCARGIALSFPEAQKNLRIRHGAVVAVTGNPVRLGLRAGSLERARKRFGLQGNVPVVLVLGGSQGAQELNTMVMETAAVLLAKTCEIILQCGSANVKDLTPLVAQFTRRNPQMGTLLHVEGFLNEQELADAYQASEVVISRAGASVVFENLLLGKAAVLIPLASSASGHQDANARLIAAAGAAQLLSPENLTGHLFVRTITTLLADRTGRARMRDNALRLAKPNAARACADLVAAVLAAPKF